MSNNSRPSQNKSRKAKRETKRRIREQVKKDLDVDFRDVSSAAGRHLSEPCRRYLDCVIDPKNAKPSGVPTLIGGEPGLTATLKLARKGTFTVGTQGLGFLLLGDPVLRGFYNNTLGHVVTTSAYTGTTITGALPVTGLALVGYSSSPYAAAAVASEKDAIGYRLVGQAVEVFPEVPVMSQNGAVAVLETMNRQTLDGETFSDVISYKNSRVVKGNDLGSITSKNRLVLNIHPRSDMNPTTGPFDFAYRIGATTTVTKAAGVIAVSGTAGDNWFFESYAIYEFRGFKAPSPKPRFVDSTGMDLVMNAFRHKYVSGWDGSAEEIKHSYLGKIGEVLAKTLHPEELAEKGLSWLRDYGFQAIKSVAGFY
jgi:hypothetical protein